MSVDHAQTAHGHAAAVQRIAVFGPVTDGPGGVETAQHPLEGFQQGGARHPQNAAILPGKGLYAVFRKGAGAQGRQCILIIAEGLIPGIVQSSGDLVGHRGGHDESFDIVSGITQTGWVFHIGGVETIMNLSGQGAVILEQHAGGGPRGDGKAFGNGHIQHVAQFPQVGVFAAHAVGHAGIDLGKGQRQGVDVAAAVFRQFVLDAGADVFHRRGQRRVALFGHVVEAGGHARAVIAGAPGLLAQLHDFQRPFAALGGIQGRKNAGQIRVGLKQLLERGITAGKGRHGLLTAGLGNQTQQAFQICKGVHVPVLGIALPRRSRG